MKRVPRKLEAQGQAQRASPRARLDAGVNPLRVSAGLIFFLAAPVFARGMPIFWAPAGLLRVARAAHRGLERPSHLPGRRGGHPRRQSALPRLLHRVRAWEPAGLRATSPLPYRLEGSRRVFASEMAVVLVAALLLTAYAARTFFGWWWLLSAPVFTAGALLLYPVALTRYDVVVALALAASVASTASSSLTSGRKRHPSDLLIVFRNALNLHVHGSSYWVVLRRVRPTLALIGSYRADQSYCGSL